MLRHVEPALRLQPLVRTLAVCLALMATACGDGGGTTAPPADNPVPTLTQLDPAAAVAGSTGLTLTVTGAAFAPDAVVEWAGSDRPTTVTAAGSARVQLAAADFAVAGAFQIRVRNPAPGGGRSGALTFTVEPVPVAAVEVEPDSAVLVPGGEAALAAAVRDAAGNALSDRPVVWTSRDPTVADLNGASGTVVAVAPGETYVVASVEEQRDSALIRVRAGGLIGASGGSVTVGHVTLDVPPGAVGSAQGFTVEDLAAPPEASGLLPGTAVTLGPEDVAFNAAVTVTMRWSDAQAQGFGDPARFAIHRWDGTAWVPLADGSVDPVARTASGKTSNFSPFALRPLPAPTGLTPDEIVFVEGDNTSLSVVDVATGMRRVLLSGEAFTPTISPSRTWIAFSREVNQRYRIFRVRFDGSGLAQLTGTGSGDTYEELTPAYSGSGERIFYSADRTGSNDRKIFSITAVGGGVEQHTSAPDDTPPRDFWPSVKGCGTTLASCSIAVARSPGGGPVQVTVVDGNGGNEVILGPLGTTSPIWSPDGQRIAYIEQNERLMVMNADGSNKVEVATFDGSMGAPSWSPDGSRLVFHALGSSTSFEFQLFVVNADGTGLVQITNDPQNPASFPAWSRN